MSAAVDMYPAYSRRFARDPTRPKPKACRNLFGRPDKEEIDQLLQSELQKHKIEDCNKYNFNFDNDTPLDGKYEWTRCDPQDIPNVYRSVAVSHGKRLPQRTPSLASEASVSTPVQSACTDTNALPTGLQARLQGLSSTSHGSGRTDKVEVINKAPKQKSTGATKKSTSSRPQTTASTTHQPKITDLLRQRKRCSDGGKPSDIKRQRVNDDSASSTSTTSH